MIVFGRKNHRSGVVELKQMRMSRSHVQNIAYGSSLILIFFACQPDASAAKSHSSAKTAGHTSTSAATHEVSEAQLVEKLRNAKVTDESFGLSVKKTPEELVVSTDKDPKFGENEVKAQSVLIAKTAFGLVPSSIQRTRVVYREPGGETSQIIVNRTEIESFGKGETTQTQLLKSLALEKAAGDKIIVAAPISTVAPGPLQPERQLQLDNIAFLKQKGANVQQLEQRFAQQEKLAAAGDKSAVGKSLASIGALVAIERMRLGLHSAATPNSAGNSNAVVASGGNTKPPHEMAALMSFLRDNQVNIYNELADLKTAHGNGTYDRAFHYRIRERLLNKFNKLPQNVRQPFMTAHPDLFSNDIAPGANQNAENSGSPPKNAAAGKKEKTDAANVPASTAGRRWPPYQAK